jgi:multiple sugar transport system permease protein
VSTATTPAQAGGAAFAKPPLRIFGREAPLGYLLLAPTLFMLLAFLAYPFVIGLWLSVTDSEVGVIGRFVGLGNYRYEFLHDHVFLSSISNTFVYTAVTTVFKLVLGLVMAVLLNQAFPLQRFVRAALLLPFIIPTVLSTLAWRWMFDPTFSVINWTLYKLSFINSRINWLGDPDLAMISVIIVNVWRGVPFYAISLLAGLQTINPELQEAAAIDGARPWQRFWHVTWPLLLPVTMVVVLFSVIQTFADFQLVYVLTGGGPANATHLFATYAYQIGIGTGLLSEGAAVSLAMFPVLLIVVIIQLLYIRRVETH